MNELKKIEREWKVRAKQKKKKKKRKTDSTVYLAAKVAHCTEIEQE